MHVQARDIAGARSALEVRSRAIGRRHPGLVAATAAVVVLALLAGFALAQRRDASSSRNQFRRSAAQLTAAVGGTLAADIAVVERASSRVGGRADLDSAALAGAIGPVPFGGTVGAVGVSVRRGDVDLLVNGVAPPHNDLLRPGASLPIGPKRRFALDLARDNGTGRIAEPGKAAYPGPPAVSLFFPLYGPGPPPATTEERRARIQGFLVGVVRPGLGAGGVLTGESMRRVAMTVSDGAFVFYRSPAARGHSRRPIVRRAIVEGGRTWTIAVWPGPGAVSAAPPVWLIVLVLLALAAGLLTLVLLRRRLDMRTEAREAARADEVRLIADTGPLLQQSLDLGELLPDFAVELADQFAFDRLAISVANEEGELVETFAIGRAPAGSPPAELYGARSIDAGEDFVMPLRRAGRTIGSVRARSRRALEPSQVASLRAVGDLLAAALGNAQLYSREQETVARLRELDQLKLSFLSTVSHELRTAVAAIEGFGALLVEHWPTLSDEQRREFIDRIARNSASLKRLVDDLLDFARLERHALTVAPRLVSLTDVVRAMVEQLASLLEQHHVELRLTPGVEAFTDPDAVERILGNFLSNAAKYSPPGSTITVAVEPAGSRALLSVADQGPGIPPEERTRVFTRFYRAETDATHRTRGAGIGLAVVKEFADRLNASVIVDSAEGGGSRFVALFPTEPTAFDGEMLGRPVPDLVE